MPAIRRRTSLHAADLRRDRTDAEQRLWQAFRNRRLGGHKFRFQHSLWPYVADFACLDAMLVVEIDGSQHTPELDATRTVAIEAKGFRILRIWNNDVLQNLNSVLEAILAACEERAGRSREPNPLPHAGEGQAPKAPG